MVSTDILYELEKQCQINPDGTCFYVADETEGDEEEYAAVSYEQLRNRSVRLARALFDQGLTRGRWAASDMPNCPELIYLLMASAINGMPLALLNNRLTSAEKGVRLQEACQTIGVANLRVLSRESIVSAINRDAKAYGEDDFDAPHLINRAHEALEQDAPALAVFTSGSFGRPCPALFTWGNIHGAAQAMNTTVSRRGRGMWQLSMPLHRVAGVQVVYRSLLNGNPFILYRDFHAQQLLDDVAKHGATHVSVWGSTLRSLVNCAAQSEENAQALRGYECILLGGSSPDSQALSKAVELKARVYASFGMTETCGNVAACLVTSSFEGRLFSLPDYQLAIISPDESGYGCLAVKGPGVFPRALNQKSVFTVDGFLLTQVLAKLDDPGVKLFRAAGASFVSAGEDVDPLQVKAKLMQVPGVTDAFVFSDEDAELGNRPIAIVETGDVSRKTGRNLQMLANEVGIDLEGKLSPTLRPSRIIAVPEFPRTGVGEVDYSQLRLLYSQRLEIRKVEAWIVSVPLSVPRQIGKVKMKERSLLTIRVTDWAGRVGIGESLAYPRVCCSEESLEDGSSALNESIAPLLLKNVFVHPSQVSVLIRSNDQASCYPQACAALESAVWDLSGKVSKRTLTDMIGGRNLWDNPEADPDIVQGCVPCGARILAGSESGCLEKVRKAVEMGCRNVRLPIRPGCDASLVSAVRREFPNITLLLDAGQSYTESNISSIQEIDGFNIACIIDPLDPSSPPKVGPQGIWERLSRLQRDFSAPLCVDRCWNTQEELLRGLQEHSNLRCASLRVGKLGGIQPALEFYWWARQRGIALIPLYEGGTSISVRAQAAFQTLPGMNLFGDCPLFDDALPDDACMPKASLEEGALRMNPEGCKYGLGCDLDDDLLAKMAERAWTLSQ